MDKEYIRTRLPERPPEGLLSWARKELHHELGHDLCIFRAERMAVPATLEEIMVYQSTKSRKIVWVASCTCSACQNDFITAKVPGEDHIVLQEGEDGLLYTLEPWDHLEPHTHPVREKPGDTFACPYCCEEVELIHAKKLRNGRTNQVMVISVENVEGYTGVFYWMVKHRISEWGISEYSVHPRDAYILTERGALVRYIHMTGGFYGINYRLDRWQLTTCSRDSFGARYYDHGSWNNRKADGVVYPVFPDLEGTTGEKTGLIEFCQADGLQPVQYLKLWRRHRNLENLCRCGQGCIVNQLINRGCVERGVYLDLTRNRPHEMLRLSREDFRGVRRDGLKLTTQLMDLWYRYKQVTGSDRFDVFGRYKTLFGETGLPTALDLVRDNQSTTLERLENYMRKQGLRCNEVGLLQDTRQMWERLYGGRLTDEELWPRDLIGAHDQVAQMLADRERQFEETWMLEGFRKVIDRYGEIQWTDGDLCIRLPQSNDDLVREGEVLRHCVGTYGRTHAKGKSIILFVRRYRRPERPYYTLNISFRGDSPKEIQLHGYGNERHGPCKEYEHRIPQKVRAFCDKWKAEVMLPWYIRNQEALKEERTE